MPKVKFFFYETKLFFNGMTVVILKKIYKIIIKKVGVDFIMIE